MCVLLGMRRGKVWEIPTWPAKLGSLLSSCRRTHQGMRVGQKFASTSLPDRETTSNICGAQDKRTNGHLWIISLNI